MKKIVVALGLLMGNSSFAGHMSVVHADHSHVHSEYCEHVGIQHGDHVDYLHDSHLHYQHGNHYDEHVIEISEKTSKGHFPVKGLLVEDVTTLPQIPHGDHSDYIYKGMLLHVHNGHLDNHGPIKVIN